MAQLPPAKKAKSVKLEPLFARLLERQLLNGTLSDKNNDLIETRKFPNDNADLTNVPANVQVVETLSTNKECDTIWITLKAPSDKDEFVTLKWPSDCDEDLNSLRTQQTSIADRGKTTTDPPDDFVTLKYPSDNDELSMPPNGY